MTKFESTKENDEFTKFEFTNKIQMTNEAMFKTNAKSAALRFVISAFEFRDWFVNSNFVNSSFRR